MSRRRVTAVLVSGLAVAAVAGIAIAGAAVARNRHSVDTSAAGGPGAPTAVQSPAPVTDAPSITPEPSTPSTPEPSAVEPSGPAVSSRPETPAAPALTPGQTPVRPVLGPLPPTQQADSVAKCKQWLAGADVPKPGVNAQPVATLTSAPGAVVILADSKYWVGCDTAYARHNGTGSIRRPEPMTGPAPGDAAAFTLANNLIPINGKQYEYYWAAGRLPSDVVKITYQVPDGRTTNAVIQGKFWLMQHQTTTPWKQGDPTPTTQIKVTLYGANGQPLRDFLLNWGEDTCAQVNHGC